MISKYSYDRVKRLGITWIDYDQECYQDSVVFFSFYCMQKMVIKDGCSLRQLILYPISYAINPVLPSFSLHNYITVSPYFTSVIQSDLEDT